MGSVAGSWSIDRGVGRVGTSDAPSLDMFRCQGTLYAGITSLRITISSVLDKAFLFRPCLIVNLLYSRYHCVGFLSIRQSPVSLTLDAVSKDWKVWNIHVTERLLVLNAMAANCVLL